MDTNETESTETAGERRSRFGLAAFLAGAGVNHFVNPGFYDPLIPDWVPGSKDIWNFGSGAAEVAAAGLLARRSTSRIGALAAFAILLAVYPANIQDSIDHPPTDGRGIGSLVRLPLQIPMFVWALRVFRRGPK